MEKLITRDRALKNKVFASFIGKWQKRFDPREDSYMTNPGKYYDWELDKERHYDQAEIDKINKKELDEYLVRKDNVKIQEFQYFGELKYNLKLCDVFIYSIEIGKIFEQLSNELGAELIFILDYNVPWLSQENDFKPVLKALNYLKEIGATKEFNGAFKLSGDELAEFGQNLFWIIRCNASLPYCWFSTDRHQFVGTVCKYGNLHFETYSDRIKKQIVKFADKHSLIKIDECIEGFSTKGGIDGRQIIMTE